MPSSRQTWQRRIISPTFARGVCAISGEEKVFAVGLIVAVLAIYGLLEYYGKADDIGRWVTNLWDLR